MKLEIRNSGSMDQPDRKAVFEKQAKWQVARSKKSWSEKLKQSLIMRQAQDLGLRMMYEPVGSPRETFENLDRLFDALPELFMMLDIGHANLHGGRAEKSIRHFAERVNHIHLHDNDGTADQHLPPGAGTVDWPAVIQALRDIDYDKTITIEVFAEDRDRILEAREQAEDWLRT